MHAMFSHCSSLVALNLSNFHIYTSVNIGHMFNDCHKLKYIDLPDFSFIPISEINLTFYNLSSLVYLNIPTLEKLDNSSMHLTFENPSPNLQICSKQENMKAYISSQSLTNNCNHDCFKQNMKIANDTNTCLTSCKDQGYNYEYLNICFHQCPEYTHTIEINNNNEVKICFDKSPEGYYLDTDGFYKKCYLSCKFCDKSGNNMEHNCIKCKNKYYFFDDSFFKNNCYQKCQYY